MNDAKIRSNIPKISAKTKKRGRTTAFFIQSKILYHPFLVPKLYVRLKRRVFSKGWLPTTVLTGIR